LVIHGAGDVNLDPAYIPALASRGYEWAWSGLEGLFMTDDVTVVNLECSPSSLGTPEAKAFTFRCAEEGLSPMAAAGVEVANLGNNHSQDFGKEAMLDGRARLEAAGISPVGAGADAAQAAAPAMFDLNGWKVAVLGFGGVRPHDGWVATADRPGMADGDTIESMVSAVRRAAALADWVVVTIHWGVELEVEPDPDDVERARALIAAGADVIFGHHTHRLQPFEVVDGRPVAWGLGNFVWPDLSPAGSKTAVARVEITPYGEITGCLLPAVIESSGHPVLQGPAECGPPA
jgi:poly-gamma-glutamate synthesis protein (capsule biosynthesis protein)